MAKYRYFGSESVLSAPGLPASGVPVSRYGQVLEFAEETGDILVAANAPIIPEDLWDEVGITDEEVAEWPSAGIHQLAPEEFQAKAKAVRVKSHGYRENMLKRLNGSVEA